MTVIQYDMFDGPNFVWVKEVWQSCFIGKCQYCGNSNGRSTNHCEFCIPWWYLLVNSKPFSWYLCSCVVKKRRDELVWGHVTSIWEREPNMYYTIPDLQVCSTLMCTLIPHRKNVFWITNRQYCSTYLLANIELIANDSHDLNSGDMSHCHIKPPRIHVHAR
jgi:hypothetical protein